MSATRLLILGVLARAGQPIHGYEVRRALELWNAEQWANIAYGSIYFALNKMAEEGLIAPVSTDQVGNRPARTTYAIAERGRQEFERLLREYWWETKPVIDPFQVAITFMDRLPRDELLAALRHRAASLRAALDARVMVRGSDTGVFIGRPPSGRSFAAATVGIFRIEDGRIVEHWGVFDQLSMLGQLGLFPGQG
jgi:DNA-binding PadR family transcriptional regulator